MTGTNVKLLPCPFCGGKGKLFALSAKEYGVPLEKDIIWYRIECERCRAKIDKFMVNEVFEAWNRRVE